MLCQDNVLKENWIVERGEMYVTGPIKGLYPRRCNVEISLILWPDKRKENTKRYLMVPITVDVTGKERDIDMVISSAREIGRPFAVKLSETRMVCDYQLLRYVGKISEKTTDEIVDKVSKLFMQCFDRKAE